MLGLFCSRVCCEQHGGYDTIFEECSSVCFVYTIQNVLVIVMITYENER